MLVADPGREFAFVTEEGGHESTVWRYRFEPVDGGTRVTESYEVKWIPAWARIVDVPTNRQPRAAGGHAPHARPAQGRRRGHERSRQAMTLDVASDAYVLGADQGEALWFADALLTYKTTGSQTSGRLTVAEVRAPRGAGSPRHRHAKEDEAWYVVEGEFTFWLGDAERTVGAGDFVFGPRDVDHRFVSRPPKHASSSSSPRPGSSTSPVPAASRRPR